MCGIFAVFNNRHASTLAVKGGINLQHRGQEASGVSTYDGMSMRLSRKTGKLERIIESTDLDETLPGLNAISHVRYATAGMKSSNKTELLRDAQPFVFRHKDHEIALAVNGELYNAKKRKQKLEDAGAVFTSTSDTEVLFHLAIHSYGDTIEDQLVLASQSLTGSYSMVMMYDDKMLVMRDPHGIRPLVMGQLGESHIFASESVALQQIGATYEREVAPGELITVDKKGLRSRLISPSKERYSCIFELIYFGNPASEYNGQRESLYTIRKRMGEELWNEHPVEADCVVPVLDSGLAASKGFSQASGIPEEIALIKNHYKGRSFIEQDQEIRENIVDMKFIPVRDQIDGKRVVLIDDSIVRSTTMRKLVETMYIFGAREVHVRSSSPPIMSPCYDAIDFHSLSELIAASKDVPEIKDAIGCTSLGYLSVDGLKNAVRNDIGYCLGCLTGKYPFEELQQRYENDLKNIAA